MTLASYQSGTQDEDPFGLLIEPQWHRVSWPTKLWPYATFTKSFFGVIMEGRNFAWYRRGDL